MSDSEWRPRAETTLNRRQRRWNRRQFLARMGVLGALTVVAPSVAFAPSPNKAEALLGGSLGGGLSPGVLFDRLQPVFQALSRDTYGGLTAFVVPGPDPYSVAQGVSTPEAGGVAAQGPEFLMNAIDNFYPVPDDVARLLVQSLATGLDDVPLELPGGLLGIPLELVSDLGDALQVILQNDDPVPISLLFALMLNQLATMADPSSLSGPYPASPFANLSFDGKAEAFRILEEDVASVVALLDGNLTEPARESLSGLLKFVAGALLEFAAFGSFSEFGVFDKATRALTGTPVGWSLSGYLAETGFQPVEGWGDFKGYYQNRKEVTE